VPLTRVRGRASGLVGSAHARRADVKAGAEVNAPGRARSIPRHRRDPPVDRNRASELRAACAGGPVLRCPYPRRGCHPPTLSAGFWSPHSQEIQNCSIVLRPQQTIISMVPALSSDMAHSPASSYSGVKHPCIAIVPRDVRAVR
jgi:hypothetical protein